MDDIYGVNFVQGTTSGDPYDDNGHGTFVAGVVGAIGNNKIGTSGVAQVASVIGEYPISFQQWQWLSSRVQCMLSDYETTICRICKAVLR